MKHLFLGEIIELRKGKKHLAISSQSKLSKRYIQIEDLRNNSNLKYTEDLGGVHVTPDDLIIAWDGSKSGTVGYGLEGLIGSTLTRLRIKIEDILPGLLGRFLQSKYKEIRANCTGAAIPHVSKHQLLQLQVPIFLNEVQLRILSILDNADEIRKKRKESIELLDEFLKSVFHDMFGDPVTNTKEFEVGTIADLVSEVKYGTSSVSGTSGEYPYLRMNNITYSGELDLTKLKHITLAEKDKEKYLTKRGDILFNRTNSKELVGKTAVYNLDEPMAIAGYLIRVRTNENATPEYISAYLNSAHGKSTLRHMCKNIVGMANINATELREIKILKPPVCLQEDFRNVQSKCNTLRAQLREQLQESDNLFNSLMQRAFKGEL